MKSAFIVFDRMTSLDFVGFYDPVTRLKSTKIIDDFEWRVCSRTRNVIDDRGLRYEVDAVDEPLVSYDMLIVPGGLGTRDLQRDRGFISSSIDMGLHLVQRLAGADAHDRIVAQMDYPYRWDLQGKPNA